MSEPDVRIVYYPDPVLLKPAQTVDSLPPDLDQIIDGMREVMKLEKGIGLAAPQVGLGLRIILVNETGEPENEKILINPEIVRNWGKKEWGEEGCLSFPEIWGEVLRWPNIAVRYRDVEGRENEIEASELLARVLQHEIDHLNGIVFVTKMRPGDQHINKKKLQELRDLFESRRTKLSPSEP